MSRVVRVTRSREDPRTWIIALDCQHTVTFVGTGRPTRRIHACQACIAQQREIAAITVPACARCGDSYCHPCPRCGTCSAPGCACQPPATIALGFEGTCESCHRQIYAGETIRSWPDHDDDVVTHVVCRPRAQA